jgi:hypothetical protein
VREWCQIATNLHKTLLTHPTQFWHEDHFVLNFTLHQLPGFFETVGQSLIWIIMSFQGIFDLIFTPGSSYKLAPYIYGCIGLLWLVLLYLGYTSTIPTVHIVVLLFLSLGLGLSLIFVMEELNKPQENNYDEIETNKTPPRKPPMPSSANSLKQGAKED